MNIKQAKEHCGYEAKPVHHQCGNCGAFASEMVYPAWVKTDIQRMNYDKAGYALVERNMRCVDHGFATKKTATCRLWRKPIKDQAAGDMGKVRTD